MQRRELNERGLDDALRAALVVDPPAELQQRLLAIAQAAARPQPAAAPQPALGFLRETSTWLCALALALVGVRLYDLLLGSGVVLGDLVEAFRVVAAVVELPSLASLTVDPLLLALWAGVAVVAWLVAERRGPVNRPDAA